jgi:hypothetical protein
VDLESGEKSAPTPDRLLAFGGMEDVRSLLDLRRQLALAPSKAISFELVASGLLVLLHRLGVSFSIPPDVFKGEMGPKLKLAERMLEALRLAGCPLEVRPCRSCLD